MATIPASRSRFTSTQQLQEQKEDRVKSLSCEVTIFLQISRWPLQPSTDGFISVAGQLRSVQSSGSEVTHRPKRWHHTERTDPHGIGGTREPWAESHGFGDLAGGDFRGQ
jgi:hypothetical protein